MENKDSAAKQVLEGDEVWQKAGGREVSMVWGFAAARASPAPIRGPKSCGPGGCGPRNICEVGGFPSVCLWHAQLQRSFCIVLGIYFTVMH